MIDPENDGDNSFTEFNYPGPSNVNPALVTGNLGALVNSGADSPVTFGFTADAILQLNALGLYSKQSASGDGANGLNLTYAQSYDGDWLVLTATEPDSPISGGDTSNPVFELRLNQVSGLYEFRLFDELIHQAPASGSDENLILRSGNGTIDALPFGDIITATDADGDSITLGEAFEIKILDDVPEPEIALNGSQATTHDETSGRQDDDGADDVQSGSLPNSIQNLFEHLEDNFPVGDDPDVNAVSGLSGKQVIGYARDDDPIVTVGGSEVGADSPPYTGTLSLSVQDGADSGLQTTEGQSIFLYKIGDLVVGRVGGANGAIAFAVAIDQGGHISVAQYLSIRHDDRGDPNEHNDNGTNGNDANPNDSPEPAPQSILSNAIKAVYTITDSDGDTREADVGIGDRIRFLDDGPKVEVDKAGGDDDDHHDDDDDDHDR